MNTMLEWSNPYELDLTEGKGLVYFARVVDDVGNEYRYVGQTKRGKKRLNDYVNNVRRILSGLSRRTTKGQEKYRAVHLALAKATQNNWFYELKPIEITELTKLNDLESSKIKELNCNLNVKWSWNVSDFSELNLSDIR
ncbi:hypothetical protein L7E62_004708 [Vibrio parahaemolyticus]|nr:hypothetical protein [Vibrio parahaemolyticus]